MELVPFSPVWLITTALEMFLVVWWLRSPVGRVWIHFLGGLLSKRHYWAPPWKHRWADDLSRPPLPFSSDSRRRLFISLIGATLLAIPAGYALLGGEAAGGVAALLFLLTQAPVCLATALVLDRATPGRRPSAISRGLTCCNR